MYQLTIKPDSAPARITEHRSQRGAARHLAEKISDEADMAWSAAQRLAIEIAGSDQPYRAWGYRFSITKK